ncbi:hypothetical protein C0J52_23365 [Blattella germanica]|nr:hypothetical protein C0J52_23365 [Blattella germanica]
MFFLFPTQFQPSSDSTILMYETVHDVRRLFNEIFPDAQVPYRKWTYYIFIINYGEHIFPKSNESKLLILENQISAFLLLNTVFTKTRINYCIYGAILFDIILQHFSIKVQYYSTVFLKLQNLQVK